MSTINQIGSQDVGTGFVPGYVTTEHGITGASQFPITTKNQDATGLYQKMWKDKASIIPTNQDIFEMSMTSVTYDDNSKSVAIPDSVGMIISPGGKFLSYNMAFINPLLGGTRAGTAEKLLGYEGVITQRYTKVYYNQWQFGVAIEKFGVNYNVDNAYGAYDRALELLKKKGRELKGRMVRECLIMGYNIEMTKPGAGEDLTGVPQHPNSNWYVGNAYASTGQAWFDDSRGMPLYDPTTATFEDYIGKTLTAAAGANGSAAAVGVEWLDDLCDIASDSNIQPFEDGKFLVTLSQKQHTQLSQIASGKLGKEVWQAVDRYTGEGKATAFPGEIGAYRSLRFATDVRTPELTVVDTAGTKSFDLKYQHPGGTEGDERTGVPYGGETTNSNFNISYLLGPGAYIERKEKEETVRKELQNYGQNEGIGIFEESGCNLNYIRTDANTSGVPKYVLNLHSIVIAVPVSR